jgi:hypothetical protein
MTGPAAALEALADSLRAEDGLLSEHVGAADARPVLGELVAAGPRTALQPGEYALLFETIREGYLLHYGQGRVLRTDDPDLALLAGDYLYARGLERLAVLGDLEAVAQLADLVSLAAQVHAREADAHQPAAALWLASAVAVACGGTEAHETAKRALRSAAPESEELLWDAASSACGGGISGVLDAAADAIGFRAPRAGTSGSR